MGQPAGVKICDTILDAIGNTPMVRINTLTRGVTEATVLVKLETFNPGNSIKDRIALRMVEDAERSGQLKPGGTIVATASLTWLNLNSIGKPSTVTVATTGLPLAMRSSVRP